MPESLNGGTMNSLLMKIFLVLAIVALAVWLAPHVDIH